MANLHPSLREVAVLHQATHMILSGGMDLDALLHEVLLIVRNYFGVSHCAVFLADEAGHVCCRVQYGYDPQSTGTRLRIGDQGVVGLVAHSRTPMYVPDVSQEPRHFCAHPGSRSELALPLVLHEELLGVLDLESDEPDALDYESIGVLGLYAGQVAIAIDNARRYSHEQRRARQIELMNLIARTAAAAREIEQFLSTLAELICDSFEGTSVAVFLRQREGTLELRARTGPREPAPEPVARAQHAGPLHDALSQRSLVLAQQLDGDHPGCFGDRGSEMAIPLVSANELLGAIAVGHDNEHYFSSDDRAIAQAAADVSATAIRNVMLGDELRRVANTDFLTGLYNQRYFHEVLAHELARASRYNKRFAVAMLDLRQFRGVNRAIGFDGGDELLRRVARALSTHMRCNDTVCRFAGDRFALVLPETDPERMTAILGKIRASLGEIQYEAEGKEHRLAAAYASAHYPQDGSTDAELINALLARAHQAKQQAAAAGGGTAN